MKEVENDLILVPRTRIFHEDESKFIAPNHFEILGQSGFIQKIDFQEGPIFKFGVNGVTNEDLIAIVICRLKHFQKSEFISSDNAEAIEAIEIALKALMNRTRKRLERGVEGTHTV